MLLNYLWFAFFCIAFIVAFIQLLLGNPVPLEGSIQTIFSMSKLGFELALSATGAMAFWLGILNIAKKCGGIHVFSKAFNPFFRQLFPSIPPQHPLMDDIIGYCFMSSFGIDNASIPFGIKIMKQLQTLNKQTDSPSQAQNTFFMLSTNFIKLIPLQVLILRMQLGASNPTDIFMPILVVHFLSFFITVVIIALYYQINLCNTICLKYFCVFLIIFSSLIFLFNYCFKTLLQRISLLIVNGIILTVIISLFILGLKKKMNLYNLFIEGAKEGFNTTIYIIPYFIGMLVAVGLLRNSGFFNFIESFLNSVSHFFGIKGDLNPLLPSILMKPFSGSVVRGMLIDVMQNYGPDSLSGRIGCIIQATASTVFYASAVYFGSVKIYKTNQVLFLSLFTNFITVIISIFIGYLFFGL